MTKEEILAMKAGRELDALIAEVIFGYRVYRYATRDWQVYSPGLHKSARRMHKYSQTMSAALLVWLKLANDGWGCNLFKWFEGNEVKFSIHRPKIEHLVSINSLEALPEAICKAALLAKYS